MREGISGKYNLTTKPMVITTRGQLVEEVMFMTVTKNRSTLPVGQPKPEDRFYINYRNQTIVTRPKMTARTQTPDPVLPVSNMPKSQTMNPLTMVFPSHTGRRIRGEGNLLRHQSAPADVRTESLVAICVAPSKFAFLQKRNFGGVFNTQVPPLP